MDIFPLGGALRSPDNYTDYVYELTTCAPRDMQVTELPEKFDLRKFTVRVKNQGMRFTCGAIVGSDLHEINKKRAGFDVEDFSSDFVYFHRVNKPGRGVYGRNVFEILQKYGTLSEKHFPYASSDEEMLKPTYEQYELAAANKIDNFARVFTIDGVKKALIEQGAIYAGLPLYNASKYFWRPANSGDKALGGHAVLLVGFKKEGFVFKNSWGPEWGKEGFGIFPYADFPMAWEFFVSIGQTVVETETETEKKRRMSLPAPITPRSRAYKEKEELNKD